MITVPQSVDGDNVESLSENAGCPPPLAPPPPPLLLLPHLHHHYNHQLELIPGSQKNSEYDDYLHSEFIVDVCMKKSSVPTSLTSLDMCFELVASEVRREATTCFFLLVAHHWFIYARRTRTLVVQWLHGGITQTKSSTGIWRYLEGFFSFLH